MPHNIVSPWQLISTATRHPLTATYYFVQMRLFACRAFSSACSSLPPHLLPSSPVLIPSLSFHSPFRDFSDAIRVSAFEFVSDKGYTCGITCAFCDENCTSFSAASRSECETAHNCTTPRRPLIQCPPVAHVSVSACPTRHITGIWTNIRQIRSAVVIVTIVQTVRPGERAGEWDKGGHLRVITAERFS